LALTGEDTSAASMKAAAECRAFLRVRYDATDMSQPELKYRWDAFCKRPFPSGYAGEEINGVCVASLDTFAAGCIDTFIGVQSLDCEKISILRKCRLELGHVLPVLEGEPVWVRSAENTFSLASPDISGHQKRKIKCRNQWKGTELEGRVFWGALPCGRLEHSRFGLRRGGRNSKPTYRSLTSEYQTADPRISWDLLR